MKLTEDDKRLLKTVVDHFDAEDRPVREAQLRRARRLKLYWNSFSQIYWSETARDYRIAAAEDLSSSSTNQDYYDRPVNVFRAFIETVIAALSIQIPAVSCSPDDADNPADILTAKAGDKIAELIYKHNDVVFAWLHALYVHYTEGMVAAYTYEKEDKSYGTYKEKQYEDEQIESFVCPHCQSQLADDILTQQLPLPGMDPEADQQLALETELRNQEALQFSDEEVNEFGPDDEDSLLHDLLINQDEVLCPECGKTLDPDLQKTALIVPKFVGMNDRAKSRVCLDIYGTLYVKTANYARDQAGTPYLIYSYETHYANALEMYPKLRDDIGSSSWAKTGVNDPYDQMARLNPQYRNAFPEEQVTVKNAWLRPASFNILCDEDTKRLKKKFPDGVKVVLVNEFVADGCNEALDDCWTLTENPMHDFLNNDPDGELLTNVQDIVNDLISLCLQTIEHGIEQTWVDPAVVNADGQSQIEATPGMLTVAKAQGSTGKMADHFFSTKAASLAPEVFQFYQVINQLGQFVSAAMPSIFGGSQESGSSRTASEYAMSRTASLQRLQIKWQMLTIWWKNVFGKAIPAYIKLVKEDERIVKKDENGNYINVLIRKAELSGKIGSVELEASEKIPVSDEQKADIIMRLMELNNAEIIEALASPENLPFIRKVVGISEFKLPGENDRQKELEEIQQLVDSEPIVIPPDPAMLEQMAMQGADPMMIQQAMQPQELPSIEIDPIVDNHQVGAQVDRNWLVSEAGRLAKIEKPAGYKNVTLHMKQHLEQVAMQMQQQMQMQMQQSEGSNSNSGQPPKPKGDSEIKESSDANAPIQ